MSRIKQSRISELHYSLLLLLLILQFDSCAQRGNYTANVIYNPPRHVIPSKVTEKWKRQVGDSVIFFFEGGFSNDRLRISFGTKSVSTTLTSNEVTQYASYMALPAPVDSVATVNFNVNGGQTVKVRPDLQRYFAVNFVKNEIVVQALDDFPYYD